MAKKDSRKAIRKPPILFKESQKSIEQLRKKLDGDVVVYWISENGSLVQDDVVIFQSILKGRVTTKRLYLFLKSDGGSGKASLRIIHLLRYYYEEIIALIPLDCASAATMLALGCDQILMGPLAYLSAIDTSITHDLSPIDHKYNDKVSVSQNELDRVLNLWEHRKQERDQNPYKELYSYIHPLVFGSVDRASSLSIKLTSEILSYHMDDSNKITEISEHLNSDYPSHSYPITFREALRIGLNVSELQDDVNELLLHLNSIYSEMAQRSHTDFDESNYHDNEILKVIEIRDEKFFYQKEKDWYYLAEERRYIPMNDGSSWKKVIKGKDGKEKVEKFHVR